MSKPDVNWRILARLDDITCANEASTNNRDLLSWSNLGEVHEIRNVVEQVALHTPGVRTPSGQGEISYSGYANQGIVKP